MPRKTDSNNNGPSRKLIIDSAYGSGYAAPGKMESGLAAGRNLHKTVHIAHSRLRYALAVFAAAFFAIVLRVADLSLLQEINENRLASRPVSAEAVMERADILDRNGAILASNLTTASLYANPKQIIDREEVVKKLSAVLPGLDKRELASKIGAEKSFVWIKRNLTPEMQSKVHRLGLPGIGFQLENRRIYPQGNLAAHILGYTDLDNQGIAGIEKSLDRTLKTQTSPLTLSVDIRVQNILREELSASIKKFNAKGGVGVIMDVHSGEILAMVSLPDFDPHDPGSAKADAKFNKASLGIYEMGSTFKIFNTAMALDSGRVSMQDRFDATSPIKIGKHQISDFHPENRWLSVPEIFEHSSNIGSAKMAQEVGAAQQKSFLRRLGLLDPMQLELPEVGKPLVPAKWGDSTTMTVSFGYGLSISPLQLVRAAAAVVNGGYLPNPTFKRQESYERGPRIMSEKTSAQMRYLLHHAVMSPEGTGRNAYVPGYNVGGKTGTAEKSTGGSYAQKSLLSSFLGVFPIENPQFVVFSMIDEPVGNKASFGYATGAWVSAPVVKNVIARMAPLLGIEPSPPQQNYANRLQNSVSWQAEKRHDTH